jgi:fermentation-respiration switch protein FrsA (DUF1100 family)
MSDPRRYDFEVEGVAMVGHLHVPTSAEPRAVAVLTGPLTSVKEQAAGTYARALADRGLLALAFDHRTFGESGGQPRQFENPFAKVQDVKGAVSALLADRDVSDVPVLGVGVCAGGGYMARAVAEDSRFQGFAAVAGYFSEATDRSIESASQQIARARAAEARWKETGVVETIPAVAAEGGDVAMPLREAYEYYGTPRGAVANYRNAFAVQSLAYTTSFDSLGAAALIEVPTLIVHSEHALAPALARRFIGNLTGPYEEVWLESQGQIDFYDQRVLIDAAADAIVRFFAPRLWSEA